MNIPFEIGQKVKSRHGVMAIQTIIVYKHAISFELEDNKWVHSVEDLEPYVEPFAIVPDERYNGLSLAMAIIRAGSFTINGKEYEVKAV